MTNKDKEMVLDELEKLGKYLIPQTYDSSGQVYDLVTWSIDDVKYTILNLPEEATEGDTCDLKSASLDYEAEYNRLLKTLAESEEEKTAWRNTVELLRNENSAMRNVIRTFEFILGRKLEL